MELNGKNKVVSLLRQKSCSRVELSRETGLVKSALTKVTKALLEEGLIKEDPSPQKVTTGRSGGRPESLLKLVESTNFSVCFYLSTEGYKSYLIDFSGKIHKSTVECWPEYSKKHTSFKTSFLVNLIVKEVESLCAHHQIDPTQLKRVAIATQGKIEQDTGIIHHSQLFKERHIPFTQLIKEQVGVECKLFNIAFCSSYQLKRLQPQHENFIALLLGYGLGVGICINSEVVTGPSGTALEISHITYKPEGRHCYCGSKGCTETYVTYSAIINDIEQLKGHAIDGTSIVEKITEIEQLLAQGDDAAHQVIQEASFALGNVLAQLITLFDVHTIMINGETSRLYRYINQYINTYLAQLNSYRFSDPNIEILREPDDDIALKGLIELTNNTILV